MIETGIVNLGDKLYSPALKEIPKPPEKFYYQGRLDYEKPHVAVVGTRRATGAGLIIAKKLASELSAAGVTIVSGLALGIDAAAHEGALAAKGTTIAVLPTSLDKIYPDQHRGLAKRIVENGGALISEYDPGTPSYKYNFLERNRIVSGLSLGIIVVEAPEKSGALSTASHALEQNREVFVVPGPINHENYKGSHGLLRAGARLVTSAAEILDDLNLKPTISVLFPEVSLPSGQKLIFDTIRSSEAAIPVDKIRDLTKMDISDLNRNLTMLLIRGFVKEEAGRYFI